MLKQRKQRIKPFSGPTESRSLPANFLWGVATSAYQTEGAWNKDGKGASIWDVFSHTSPSSVDDGSNGDEACNLYERNEEVVKIIKDLGISVYRFSISWARILPDGIGRINELGIAHYKELIELLLENGVQSMICLYHWDHPQVLEDQGGWLNDKMADWFEEFAKTCFTHFGDKVKFWLTINEGRGVANDLYGHGLFASTGDKSHPAEYPYIAAHNMLRAHAKAYRLYEREFKQSQQGRIGMAHGSYWTFPESEKEVDAAKLKLCFDFEWFQHPVFVNGDYPEAMKRKILEKSLEQNFLKSRLPEFTEEEKKMLKGSADFLGINYYSSQIARHEKQKTVSCEHDPDCFTYQPASWKGYASKWLKLCPSGLSNYLQFIKENYNNISVIITENGCSDDGSTLLDTDRIEYLKLHLDAIYEGIKQGCNVIGYVHWSLLDNFEWSHGYTKRFGLYYVDFSKVEKPLKKKASADAYAAIVKTNCIV